MGRFDGLKRYFTFFLPRNKCMACGDEVRPAGAVMGNPDDPRFMRMMSIKPGYTCSKCGGIICSECIKKGTIWRCPLCGGEIKRGIIRYSGFMAYR